MAHSHGEEHDARDMARVYSDAMCEDAMEFGDPLANVRAPTQEEFKIAERVSAYNSGDMSKVVHIDEFNEEFRK